MILPTKHAITDRSLVVLGGRLLAELREPIDLGRLWEVAKEAHLVTNFERFYSAVVFLHIIGTVNLHDGRLVRRSAR